MTFERRALVVESDPDTCGLVRETLEADGFCVRTADAGAAALTALQQDPTDLVFIASSLPDTSGLTLHHGLRNHRLGG
jgi:DNA-binding response OmpR family regulator